MTTNIVQPIGYTTAQVCKLLQTSKTLIYEEMKAGRLAAFKIGRSYRFTQKAIDDYVALCAVKPDEIKDEQPGENHDSEEDTDA